MKNKTIEVFKVTPKQVEQSLQSHAKPELRSLQSNPKTRGAKSSKSRKTRAAKSSKSPQNKRSKVFKVTQNQSCEVFRVTQKAKRKPRQETCRPGEATVKRRGTDGRTAGGIGGRGRGVGDDYRPHHSRRSHCARGDRRRANALTESETTHTYTGKQVYACTHIHRRCTRALVHIHTDTNTHTRARSLTD